MSFDTFPPHLQHVARCASQDFSTKWGRRAVVEQPINAAIPWSPTFYVKYGNHSVIAAEVSEEPFPQVLKLVALDIIRADTPISIYAACPLEVFLDAKNQRELNALKKMGFGVVTVDSDGGVLIQHHCIPLVQFIPEEDVLKATHSLPQALKNAFRDAHHTYMTNVGAGTQQAGVVVEALVGGIVAFSVKNGWVSKGALGNTAADNIDGLYGLVDDPSHTKDFVHHRAALGGARDFMKEFRNVASHAPKSSKAAAEKLRKCKEGFMTAVRVACSLTKVMKAKGIPIKVHL